MEGNSTSSCSSMLSINMRVFKTVLLIAFFGVSVRCLPVTDKPTESKTEIKIESETESGSKAETTTVVPQETTVTVTEPTFAYSDYYDQRQNGTENYRIHLDGLVFVFAPVEALLLASAAAGTSEPALSISNQGAGSLSSFFDKPDKPAIDSVHNKTDLASSKTIHK